MDDKPHARRRRYRRALLASAGGTVVLGGVLVTLPWGGQAAPPAPTPQERALAAVTSGVPAALPGLDALAAERERHLRTHPRDARAWAELGAARVEQGLRLADPRYWPRAENALRTALKVRKDDVPALRAMAVLANARRDHAAARAWGEAARKLEPERWTTYPPLIEASAGLGDDEETGRLLEKLAKLRSGPEVMARAAAVYRDRGWREDAAAKLADAASAAGEPAERAAYLERAGQLAWERGDRQDALRHFQEAVRTDPDQRAAQAGQGRVLAALGRTTEALSAYRTALADHGDSEAAVRRLRAEWRRQPSTEVADALGWALHRAGEHEEALPFAVRATEGTEGGGVRSGLFAYHRGMIELSLERYGAARRHLTEALRINPWFSPLHAPRAKEALARLGEPSVQAGPESS
ncbi:tetratricopeptide repeat protein [Streptomyces werraensis]|uniref:tetratricopeptide repeat protein n=1 Tax=Streptomyces werraensis TaxID=68284 RepID=UPI0033A18273